MVFKEYCVAKGDLVMYTIMRPDFIHEDERGSLVQLLHDGWRQVNIIFSKDNTVRGGHYHKKNR